MNLFGYCQTKYKEISFELQHRIARLNLAPGTFCLQFVLFYLLFGCPGPILDLCCLRLSHPI